MTQRNILEIITSVPTPLVEVKVPVISHDKWLVTEAEFILVLPNASRTTNKITSGAWTLTCVSQISFTGIED